VMGTERQDSFQRDLVNDFDWIATRVSKVDVRQAECRNTVECNAIVHELLRMALVYEGKAALAQLLAAERGTSVLINNLAWLLQDQGDFAGAAPLYHEALEGSREKLGKRHPAAMFSIWNLCVLMGDRGQESAAKQLCREAVVGAREALGAEHPQTRYLRNQGASSDTSSDVPRGVDPAY